MQTIIQQGYNHVNQLGSALLLIHVQQMYGTRKLDSQHHRLTTKTQAPLILSKPTQQGSVSSGGQLSVSQQRANWAPANSGGQYLLLPYEQ